MTLFIFSDSHGKTAEMQRLVRIHRPDAVFHLGDHVRDARSLEDLVPVTAVRGNCDGSAAPEEMMLALEGVTLLLLHGHACGVKSGLGRLLQHARQRGAQLALFGHTHQAFCQTGHGVTLFNPGSVSCPRRGAPGYGRLTLTEGTARCELLTL